MYVMYFVNRYFILLDGYNFIQSDFFLLLTNINCGNKISSIYIKKYIEKTNKIVRYLSSRVNYILTRTIDNLKY